MSVVIIGGHERMENRYREICKSYHHKPKIFTKMRADLSRQIGTPDLMILFTATASHKMVRCAVAESERRNIKDRQKQGIAAAKKRGVRFGRPETIVPKDFSEIVDDWQMKRISLAEALNKSHMSRSTFYRKIRKDM